MYGELSNTISGHPGYRSARSTALPVRDDSYMAKSTFIDSMLSRPLLVGSLPVLQQSAKYRTSLTKKLAVG